MRKTSYVVTFAAVAAILTVNIISARRPDWFVLHYDEVPHTKVTITYGLVQRCELTVTEMPRPPDRGKTINRDYECRKFPTSVTDRCDKENKTFCLAWTSAAFLNEIALGFGPISLLAILFGVSTHSRRRRIWTAVAGLVLLQAACQMSTFGIVTNVYLMSSFPSFEHARPGTAYILHTLCWIFSVLVTFGVLLTGISASAGHRWAAGNRVYQSIP